MMCIYKITDLTNEKIYVGKTKNLKRRIKEYRCKSKNLSNKKSQYRIMKVIHEKGFENFEFSILEEIIDPDLLDAREIYWISRLGSRDPNIGYNSKTGGSGGSMIELSKDLMSKNSFGFRHTEEEKKKRRKPIIVIDTFTRSIEEFDSAKEFASVLNIDRAQVTHAIKRGITLKNYFVFYFDYDLRRKTFDELKIKKKNGGYNAKKSFESYVKFYKIVNNLENLKV